VIPAGRRKFLVVVTADVDAGDLHELPDFAGEKVRVVAPLAQLSHAQWLANDDRQEREAAETRAHRVAGAVAPEAERTVGDDDVLLAIEDELRTFDADEIWLVMSTESEANWLETGVLGRALARFGVPVVRVVTHGAGSH
jgi:hypothetical protein